MTPVGWLKALDFPVKRTPLALCSAGETCVCRGRVGNRHVAREAEHGAGVTPGSVPCAANPAGTGQLAALAWPLLLLVYVSGFVDFSSDVTHKIARNGELLCHGFHFTPLPKETPFIVVNNRTEESLQFCSRVTDQLLSYTVLTNFNRN